MATETKPGFTLISSGHQVRFVTALQNGDFSPDLENLTDWTELMEIVARIFDTNDRLEGIKKEIEDGCNII